MSVYTATPRRLPERHDCASRSLGEPLALALCSLTISPSILRTITLAKVGLLIHMTPTGFSVEHFDDRTVRVHVQISPSYCVCMWRVTGHPDAILAVQGSGDPASIGCPAAGAYDAANPNFECGAALKT